MMSEGEKRKRGMGDYGYLLFSGAAMGAADVVPGVSGGTMAFILGVYEELILSIKSFNLQFLRLLARLRFGEAFRHVNGAFLLVLGSGIAVSILSLARLLTWLLAHHVVLLYAFFFGLVAASILAVSTHVRWTPGKGAALLAGSCGAYHLVGLVPLDMPHDAWTLFYSGAIAICAMILPGISGSFLLLILGQYEFILAAVRNFDLAALLPAAAGMVVGIAAFSRILGWLLKRHHQVTITLLVGFMLGSLRRIWPFKETLEHAADRYGNPLPARQVNVLPDFGSRLFWAALGLGLLGFVLISVLDHTRSRANPFFRLLLRTRRRQARCS